ncbi:YitT family protein [Lentilactobacillus sp. SPB1-3]|uniref:YitT family protein n=1 Tax=Lentilactobacillus terminaliae TaxID=3003483 RepID=A0ACD5DCM8_9LACO|nr:YitT family protein [Lentilactobacillus sp. SPB1-3]MCZ0977247.1 YitT family protein [Lentilactobacillus sp. SPB1-3]
MSKVKKLFLNRVSFADLLVIALGTALYSFGIIYFNLANKLADGGVTGITLILKALFNFNPAYSTIIVNIPLFLIGMRFLGKRDMFYTLYGILALSFFLWVWQQIPIHINLQHDLLLASLGAGLFGGFGSGLVYRFGGTTGGIDIIARLFERFRGIQMGQSLLVIDVLVLLSSLIYLDIRQMAYTLIYIYIFSQIVNFTQQGAYTARGIIIISNHSEAIAASLMEELSRGVTYLNAEGGYSRDEKQVIYTVVSPSELHGLKQIVEGIDKQAFISIINVHEAIGEGFTYKRPKKFNLFN